MKSQFTQQYIVNAIAKLLAGKVSITTMEIANDLGDLFQHCEPSDHINEIKGFTFEKDIGGSRFIDIDEAIESADDHISAYVSNACTQASGLLREKHKIMSSGKASESILELHDLERKMAVIAKEYKAAGLKPIEFKLSATIKSQDIYDSVKGYMQDDRDLEPFVDVNVVSGPTGLTLDVWVPDDKTIIDRVNYHMACYGCEVGPITLSSVPHSIPGYKSVDDYIKRLDQKRVLDAEFEPTL